MCVPGDLRFGFDKPDFTDTNGLGHGAGSATAAIALARTHQPKAHPGQRPVADHGRFDRICLLGAGRESHDQHLQPCRLHHICHDHWCGGVDSRRHCTAGISETASSSEDARGGCFCLALADNRAVMFAASGRHLEKRYGHGGRCWFRGAATRNDFAPLLIANRSHYACIACRKDRQSPKSRGWRIQSPLPPALPPALGSYTIFYNSGVS